MQPELRKLHSILRAWHTREINEVLSIDLEQIFENITPKKVFKWLIFIFFVALFIGVSAFLWYFINFTGGLSPQREVWGVFGDYIGGILNPIFSFLALAALLLTIIIQSKELEQTRRELERTADANREQSKIFVSQLQREDIYKLITKLSDRINSNYKKSCLPHGKSIHTALSGSKEIINNYYLLKLHEDVSDTNTPVYQIIKYLEHDLIKLQNLLEEYEKVSKQSGGSTPFPNFFRSEYCEMVEVFHQLNVIEVGLLHYFCERFTTDS